MSTGTDKISMWCSAKLMLKLLAKDEHVVNLVKAKCYQPARHDSHEVHGKLCAQQLEVRVWVLEMVANSLIEISDE